MKMSWKKSLLGLLILGFVISANAKPFKNDVLRSLASTTNTTNDAETTETAMYEETTETANGAETTESTFINSELSKRSIFNGDLLAAVVHDPEAVQDMMRCILRVSCNFIEPYNQMMTEHGAYILLNGGCKPGMCSDETEETIKEVKNTFIELYPTPYSNLIKYLKKNAHKYGA